MKAFFKHALAVAAVAAAATLSAAPAQAQFWGSGGKQVVSFPSSYSPGQVVVSFQDRRLYHVVARGRAVAYPVAAPKQGHQWSGTLRVSRKQVNPTWVPTPRMRRENPRLPAVVPGGHPRNPLGYRALYLGSTLYRIHGTDAPHLIGRSVSSGCIRMHNDHVAELYNKVGVGTKVTVTYKSFGGGGYVASSSSYGSASGLTSSSFSRGSVFSSNR